MPKLKLSDLEQKKLVTRVTIKKRMELKQIRNQDIAKRLNVPDRSVRYRWQYPDTLRLGDLWSLVTFLGLSDQEILQIARGKEIV